MNRHKSGDSNGQAFQTASQFQATRAVFHVHTGSATTASRAPCQTEREIAEEGGGRGERERESTESRESRERERVVSVERVERDSASGFE